MLDAAGFATFDRFPLRSRFVDPATGEVGAHFAGRVLPLSAARAEAFADEAATRCAESGDFTVTFRTDDSPGLVLGRLRELPVAEDDAIIVSWARNTAVVTEWSVFVAHWDDFCYPASDDISLWPIDGGWTLCYRHYEVIQFRSHPRFI